MADIEVRVLDIWNKALGLAVDVVDGYVNEEMDSALVDGMGFLIA